ncbi:hypothetical protein B0T17DRAFT_485575 [Bombardia bombarda]|uniref:Protein farnesyltransferase/geranylgeranyltransferase type-1 subunit alpha n=1 Tax=Bombardia bombarda TaxID=252184 RepID=A0AA39XJT8_9PEZI|nr:hypothetical protein B0T17DRAFT_485575 [Bombardia bombarda]
MPPKGKAAPKPKGTENIKPSTSSSNSTSSPAAQQPTTSTSPSGNTPTAPSTIGERSQQRFHESRPFDAARQKLGLSGLSQAEQTGWVSSQLAARSSTSTGSSRRTTPRLGPKAQRELWRHVNDASLPIRTLKNKKSAPTPADVWGTDRAGQKIAGYSIARYEERAAKRTALTALQVTSRAFREARERAKRGLVVTRDHREQPIVLVESAKDVQEEKQRRRQMAALRRELYGEMTGEFRQDPEWDGVEPIPQVEPEAALATISYPEEYAEAISYLRAVMLQKEYSPRCLRLTDHIISMNAAHYTVWLYRAANVFALQLPIPDEIDWLNGVALANLKNYQIWHHRHLLVDNYYPTLASGPPSTLSRFADSEREFLSAILAHDTKNYHVWSYRSYLVSKLGLFDAAEIAAMAALIGDDVRNNSAWSHRFFVVFSDPRQSTPGTAATDADPAVPREVVDREAQYAMDKIYLAPQNQSAWNYLRGVLVKGGRGMRSVEGFVSEFVRGLGEGEEREDVLSTHALDLLAEICKEKGERERADLCLRRLGEKWDRIRVGYWEWRRRCLDDGQ